MPGQKKTKYMHGVIYEFCKSMNDALQISKQKQCGSSCKHRHMERDQQKREGYTKREGGFVNWWVLHKTPTSWQSVETQPTVQKEERSREERPER